MSVPAAAAARAIPGSPSGCAIFRYAIGATSTGMESSSPSTVTAVVTVLTSTRTRGLSRQPSNAATFARTVCSSPAPPAK